MHDDALIAQPDFIRVDGKLRRRGEAQLPINNGRLQVNRLVRARAFDFGQHLKEGRRRDLFFIARDEFGKGLIKTFFAHRSMLLLLPSPHALLPQIESDDDELLTLETDLHWRGKKVSGGFECSRRDRAVQIVPRGFGQQHDPHITTAARVVEPCDVEIAPQRERARGVQKVVVCLMSPSRRLTIRS